MTDIVIQGIGGRMGHVLCDMIAQREGLPRDCRHRHKGWRTERHPCV